MTVMRRRRGANAQPPGRCAPIGFTLLEILLATVLAVTLLAALWSLLSMQARLFGTTPAKIERCQLARSLVLQLTDDLQRVLFVPADEPGQSTTFVSAATAAGAVGSVATAQPAAAPTGGILGVAPKATATVTTATGRPGSLSALIGTEQSLRLQILQVLAPPPTAFRQDRQEEREEDRGPRVPELCTVSYTFESPDEADRIDRDESTRQIGLVRREIPWDAPDADTGLARVPWSAPPESSTGAIADRATNAGRERESSHLPETDRPVGSTIDVPEVIGIAFRFFDGSTWSSWWDSRERRSLPAAVEATVQFDVDRRGRDRRVTGAREDEAARTISPEEAAEEIAAPDESMAAQDMSPDAPAADRPRAGRFRFVIFLPAAPRLAEHPPQTETAGTEVSGGAP